jgi:Ran GTPase-activating protein (RanGAP) involved in mRNA processing and transport
VPIEQVLLHNNGLKAPEMKTMVECLEAHFDKIHTLKITQNKIGFQGAETLASCFKVTKNLKVLDLSHDEIGDQGLEVIAKELGQSPANIEELNLAGNCLGKFLIPFGKAVQELTQAFSHFSRLHTLSLAHNNLRGDSGGKIDLLLRSLGELGALSNLDLSWNNLGAEFGRQMERKPAPVCHLADLLVNAATLKRLNVAHNNVDSKGALALGFGLSKSKTIKWLDVGGNPIGKGGMRFLMQALSENSDCKFQVEMKNISADQDLKQEQTDPDQVPFFDPLNPEDKFQLDLSAPYYQVILQYLLAAAERAAGLSEGAFEVKQCFAGVTFNGKAKWDPPLEKNSAGIYNLGEEPSGVLKFQFSLNPPLLKEQQKLLKKAEEAGDSKLVEQIQRDLQRPSESLQAESISRQFMSPEAASFFFKLLLERYKDQDENSAVEFITALAQQHSLWFSQAHEALYVCKLPTQFSRVAPFVMGQMADRHLRFAIANHANYKGGAWMQQLQSQVKQSMGTSSFLFSAANPTGHYCLKLDDPVQRQVAKHLLFINQRVNQKIAAKEWTDRSQQGNQSCFRNESLDGFKFKWSKTFRLPSSGLFECDFVALDLRPDPELTAHDSEVKALASWFEKTWSQLKASLSSKRKEEGLKKAGQILGESFRGVAEYFCFSSEQLSFLLNLFEEEHWRVEVFLAGVGRLTDFENADFIKQQMKFPGGMAQLYKSFGILNLFNPLRPNGSYIFKLDVFEERTTCKALLELSKGEGWGNWTEVKVNGKKVEALTADFLAALPEAGTFEGVYNCPPEKEKEELRRKLGAKYLDWDR